MPRAPTPPMRPTVLPACAPRVRSARSPERYGAVQIRRTAQRGSLARTPSVPATTTAASSATRPLPALAALARFAALAAFCADGSHCRGLSPAGPATTRRLAFRLRRQRLHRETQTTALVAIEQLDRDAITLLHDILGLLGASVLELGDVDEAFGAGHDLDKRAERGRALDCAFVRLANHRLRGERLNHLTRSLHRLAPDRGDRYQPGIIDCDLSASLLLDTADRLPLRSDQIADLLRIDVHRHDARRILRQIRTRLRERLRHLAKNVKSSLTRLRQCFLDDLEIESFDLDVHLDRSDSVLGASDLEVHVAEVILCTEDVGEDRVLRAFLDQTHGNAGHRGAERNTGVEQRQRATAHRRHRRGPVRLENVRHDADRIREILEGGQHALQRALGAIAVSDLTATGAAHPSNFTSRARWEIGMKH